VVRDRPVYLLAPAAPIEAAKRAAQRRVLVVAGIGLAVSVVLGLLLATTVIRPIRRLARAVGAIREGEVRDELPRGGGREVEDLRTAFGQMLVRLDQFREELVSREKMATLGQFSAAVAHELRNPLSSMRMTLDLLRDEVGPDARADIDRLRAEAARLDHSVEELLFYAGRPRYEMGPADLADVAADAIRIVRPLADHLEVDLVAPEDGGSCPVRGDANRLRQALVNLLLNAVQACEPGQAVGVEFGRSPDGTSVMVSDDGPGVPEDLEERLFEPFVTGRAGGTGLGLSVTAAIATAHDGEVRHERAGGRTRFILRLPNRGS
jgi:signal transduction histidine kinase